MVLWPKNWQTSTIAPQIGCFVHKCANINHSTSNWLFGPKIAPEIGYSIKKAQTSTTAPEIGY